MIEIDKIYLEDCLEGMKRIDDGSVDCIITDLPYGVLNEASEGGSWDTIIPFDKLWEQYNRVIKPNGAILLFGQGMFTSDLMQSNRKMWRYNLVWDKVLRKGFLNANRMPLRSHEDICVFYKNLPTYNPQMEPCLPHQRNHGRGVGGNPTNRCYGDYKDIPVNITDEKYPGSILTFQKGHNKESWLHPTQKPVSLIEYLVLTYTNKGDLVLDSCMGSGTTAIACIKAKRHFVGFETDEGYFRQAEKRIWEERRQTTLDFEE